MSIILVMLHHSLVWRAIHHKGCGLTQGWYPDTSSVAAMTNTGFVIRQQSLIRRPDPNGCIQYAIPIRHIFCFVDDYSKVTNGMQDTLQ